MALVLLNTVRLQNGPNAPGSVFDYAFEQELVDRLIEGGGVFADDATLGDALDRATRMRLAGAPLEDVEAFLMTFAGDDVTALARRHMGFNCIKPIFPFPPPIHVACGSVMVWLHAGGELPRILMRGIRAPGRIVWAGSTIANELAELADVADCELGDPMNARLAAFAEESVAARRRGAVTWEQNEAAATRVRFLFAVDRCHARSQVCPPTYFPEAPCACNPYSFVE